MPDWRERAEQLVAELVAHGTPIDPRWQAALRETPRHEFVPRWLSQDEQGRWYPVAPDDPATAAEWTARTYTDVPLVTAVDDAGMPISSSSQPGLMVRMLDALDIADDSTVLEIGIGTGYNVALLCHRLPAEQVHSIDVEPELTELARERLARLGHAPRLATRDGVTGWPEHAPYDRIIATCAVPRIPPAWVEQVRPGGLVLADVKIGAGSGNLALLRAGPNGLQGRFDATSAGFMALRSPTVPLRTTSRAGVWGSAERALEPGALPEPFGPVEVFFAALDLPGNHLARELLLDHDSRAVLADRYTAADGSWVEVDRTGPVAAGRARTAGATPLLDLLLDAHARYTALGRPGWDRFTLAVATDGTHTVTVDAPDAPSWVLPPL
ncbi:methyltransferase domain-containing protein [Pseudonocardia sp. CA-107938]|uniref:methyltransferase domain-containing protein n=1 Tax=Pseudonocardia sp. CA-107938 TaxID=3240021 RepID=UPI003D90C518